MGEQEGSAEEDGFGQYDVGGLGGERGRQRVLLGRGGPGKDVLDVERDRVDALEPGALRKSLQEVPVVEVGLGGKWDERGTGCSNAVGESGAGQETDVVAAVDESLRNGQERCDVAVGRHAGDEYR